MTEKKIPAPRKIRKVSMPNNPSGILLVTTDSVPGRSIERTIGFVSGSSAQVMSVGRSLTAGLGQLLVGGDVPDFTALMEDARLVALARLKQKAAAMGANAVVGLRLTTSDLSQAVAEVCAYGTAVRLSERDSH